MEDYEIEEKKQAAADVLFNYSQFIMVCAGQGVRPSDLRLHLMKEISGMPSSLMKFPRSSSMSSNVIGESSSSSSSKKDKSDTLQPHVHE